MPQVVVGGRGAAMTRPLDVTNLALRSISWSRPVPSSAALPKHSLTGTKTRAMTLRPRRSAKAEGSPPQYLLGKREHSSDDMGCAKRCYYGWPGTLESNFDGSALYLGSATQVCTNEIHTGDFHILKLNDLPFLSGYLLQHHACYIRQSLAPGWCACDSYD